MRWLVVPLLVCVAFGVIGPHAHATPHGHAAHDSPPPSSSGHQCLVYAVCLPAVLPLIALFSLLFLGTCYAMSLMTNPTPPAFALFKPPRFSLS